MSLELKDWEAYCNGLKDFDKSHFYTLLMDNDDGNGISDKDFQLVFESFTESESLINRLKSYYLRTDFRNEIINIQDYLVHSVTKDIQEKIGLFEGEELEVLLRKEVQFVEEIDLVLESKSRDWQNEEYIDVLEDYIFDRRIEKSPKTDSLFEAYFGLTHNYQLVWYLASPLINTGINFNNYYDIWKVGGEYAITDEGVIVSRISGINQRNLK